MKKYTFKSNEDFLQNLNSNSEIQNMFKNDPIAAMDNIEIVNPLATDKWVYRLIVIALGLTILITITGVIVLVGIDKVNDGKGVPDVITAIGSAAIGALAGLLVPPPKETV